MMLLSLLDTKYLPTRLCASLSCTMFSYRSGSSYPRSFRSNNLPICLSFVSGVSFPSIHVAIKPFCHLTAANFVGDDLSFPCSNAHFPRETAHWSIREPSLFCERYSSSSGLQKWFFGNGFAFGVVCSFAPPNSFCHPLRKLLMMFCFSSFAIIACFVLN